MAELNESDILTDRQEESAYVQKVANDAVAAAERAAEEAKKNTVPEPQEHVYSQDDRTDESADFQASIREKEAAAERRRIGLFNTMLEYTSALDELPGYMRQAMHDLERMRAANVPDVAAYQELHTEMKKKYEQFQELSQHMVAIEEDTSEADSGMRKMAQLIMRKDRIEKLEDAYRKAETQAQQWGRRETDATKEARKTPPELYDERLAKVMENGPGGGLIDELDTISSTLRFATEQGKGQKWFTMLHDQIDVVEDRLKEMDKELPSDVDPMTVPNRRMLQSLIDQMRELMPRTISAASPLTDSRATLAMSLEGEEEILTASLEHYNTKVRELMDVTVELEEKVDAWEKDGKKVGMFNNDARNILRRELTDIYEQLDVLNHATVDSVTEKSRERTSLLDLFQKLNSRLRAEKPKGALSSARAVLGQIKAQYAAVQHTLSEEQRREMRLSIARMREAVSQVEDEASELTVQSAIQLAVAHATEHAPELATAVLASLPTAIATPQVTESRGFFGAISAALKTR